MSKPECDPRSWHDSRHDIQVRMDNRCIAPSWPLDAFAFFAEVYCRNGCGLLFCAILKQFPLPEKKEDGQPAA